MPAPSFSAPANTNPSPNNTTATTTAIRTLILPAAIGLKRFLGCSRSRSRSAISFTMYTAELRAQNAAIATASRPAFAQLNANEKNSGANKSRFLIQCFGLSSFNQVHNHYA